MSSEEILEELIRKARFVNSGYEFPDEKNDEDKIRSLEEVWSRLSLGSGQQHGLIDDLDWYRDFGNAARKKMSHEDAEKVDIAESMARASTSREVIDYNDVSSAISYLARASTSREVTDVSGAIEEIRSFLDETLTEMGKDFFNRRITFKDLVDIFNLYFNDNTINTKIEEFKKGEKGEKNVENIKDDIFNYIIETADDFGVKNNVILFKEFIDKYFKKIFKIISSLHVLNFHMHNNKNVTNLFFNLLLQNEVGDGDLNILEEDEKNEYKILDEKIKKIMNEEAEKVYNSFKHINIDTEERKKIYSLQIPSKFIERFINDSELCKNYYNFYLDVLERLISAGKSVEQEGGADLRDAIIYENNRLNSVNKMISESYNY